jgi:sugar lactone lactonase YvrE
MRCELKALLIMGMLAVITSPVVPYVTAAEETTTIIRMESRTFPDPIVWDSNYTACLAASDGRVYVGLNHHGAGASVAVYDPETDRMRLLGDMNRIIGQQNLRAEPQAKVHTQICEGRDGKIYFGTHLSAFYGFGKFTSPEAYPGGHWMVYDPESDTVTDLGLALKRNGLITMTMDPERERLYALTYPQGHFVSYDIPSGRTTDMGKVQNWDALSRTLARDDRGRIFGCYANGKLWRYDPDSDRIEFLQARLPQREVGVPVHRAYWETEQTFTAVAHSPDHTTIYFLETGSSYLVEYDPHSGAEGEMTLLDQICADRYRGQRDIPYAMISFCRGPDNVIYYLNNSAEADEEGSPYWGGGMASSLVTYDLDTGERKDHGLVRVEEGLTVVHPNAASAAPDGTIYFVAHVLEPPGEGRSISGMPADLVLEQEPEHKKGFHEGQSFTLRLIIHRPTAVRTKGGSS